MSSLHYHDSERFFEGSRGERSALRMRVLPIERRKPSRLMGYFLRNPYRSYMMVLGVAIALSAATAWAQELPEVHQQGDISYVSGGIGDAETEYLASVKKDYNLQLISTDASGHYLGGSHIVISDAKKQPLVDVVAAGPIFYASLPNGRYHVESTNAAESKKRSLKMTSGNTVRIHNTWALPADETIQ